VQYGERWRPEGLLHSGLHSVLTQECQSCSRHVRPASRGEATFSCIIIIFTAIIYMWYCIIFSDVNIDFSLIRISNLELRWKLGYRFIWSCKKFSAAASQLLCNLRIRIQILQSAHIVNWWKLLTWPVISQWNMLLGCIHIHTSTSPGTCIRVPVNTSLHVFEWWPFTLTPVLYEYELPVNFTRTSSFCTGRVFIQPIRCKQKKICISLIYTRHYAYLTS